jgi:class 3 adenylate cyclase
MRVSGWLLHLANRALAESMDVRSMIHLARRFIRNYDLYERMGFSRNMSIPNKDAARQIVSDMKESELMLEFVSTLIKIHEVGLGGRKYRVPYLGEMVAEIRKTGLIYDKHTNMFYEDPRVMQTMNWGVLRENEEYIFTFLRIDIVGNSTLVRQHPEKVIKKAYADLRKIVQSSIIKRNGRIWNWEGDGGLVAFYLSNKNIHAVISAMEILHELHIYNMVHLVLNNPLRVRMAVHSGLCQFKHNFEDIKSDTIKKIMYLESTCTKPDSISVSSAVYQMLNQTMVEQLRQVKSDTELPYYCYELRWEE